MGQVELGWFKLEGSKKACQGTVKKESRKKVETYYILMFACVRSSWLGLVGRQQ